MTSEIKLIEISEIFVLQNINLLSTKDGTVATSNIKNYIYSALIKIITTKDCMYGVTHIGQFIIFKISDQIAESQSIKLSGSATAVSSSNDEAAMSPSSAEPTMPPGQADPPRQVGPAKSPSLAEPSKATDDSPQVSNSDPAIESKSKTGTKICLAL